MVQYQFQSIVWLLKKKNLVAGNLKRDQEVVPGPFIYYNAHKKKKRFENENEVRFFEDLWYFQNIFIQKSFLKALAVFWPFTKIKYRSGASFWITFSFIFFSDFV